MEVRWIEIKDLHENGSKIELSSVSRSVPIKLTNVRCSVRRPSSARAWMQVQEERQAAAATRIQAAHRGKSARRSSASRRSRSKRASSLAPRNRALSAFAAAA